MPRVLLVSMPWGSLERPSLGLGLIQAQLRRRGVPCETRYLGFDFAAFLGADEYRWVAGGLPHTAFAGDWLFADALYGARPGADARYVDEVLRGQWAIDDRTLARLLGARAYVEPYLAHCLASVPWRDFDVIGFTSTFEQNIASLALARRVDAAHPRAVIVFGGANWEGEMGVELHRRFPFVDAVCSGEADHSFPAFLDALDRGTPLENVRGIVFRDRGRTRTTGPAPLVRDLDALPIPDYDAFVAQQTACPSTAGVLPALMLETGRGCWWGAKSHCTFCGLNGGGMAFRSKTAERALDEIHALRDRYGAGMLNVVDNILDMGYFRTLLPRLAAEGGEVSLFYEIKANLSTEQVSVLAAAGVRCVQPGIESLSDHVLKLMRKGTTTLQNVELLKWCREHGVRPEWNILYGVPGERDQDHAEAVDAMEAIPHLDPPSGLGPIRLDRFSPYHSDPAAHGISAVRPMAAYRHLYPFGAEAVRRIAYYFDFDHVDGRGTAAAASLVAATRRWMAEGPRPGLWAVRDGDATVIVDDRGPGGRRVARLEGWRASAYASCDRRTTPAAVLRDPALAAVPAEDLDAFLAWCSDMRFTLERDGRHLGLAVTTPARSWQREPALDEAAA